LTGIVSAIDREMSIQIEFKHAYGKEWIYPVCNKAKLFAELIGQKTLTRENIGLIKQLGYKIEIVQEPRVL
jgi:hypothetical protein